MVWIESFVSVMTGTGTWYYSMRTATGTFCDVVSYARASVKHKRKTKFENTNRFPGRRRKRLLLYRERRENGRVERTAVLFFRMGRWKNATTATGRGGRETCTRGKRSAGQGAREKHVWIMRSEPEGSLETAETV